VYKRAQKVRLLSVSFIYLSLFTAVFFRLLSIQVINRQDYSTLADSQHQLTLTLAPQRGIIYDRMMKMMALSLRVSSVYAEPRVIVDKERTARLLAAGLQVDESLLQQRLAKDNAFMWVKRRVTTAEVDAVTQLNMPGVGMLDESKRFYPNSRLAAHVVGFAGVDEMGLEGLERQYDAFLQGTPGRRVLLRDAKQRMLPAFEYEYTPAVDGNNLVLTIDQVIQHIVEEEIDRALPLNHAQAAMVVVMDPFTGDIYALASRPGYDLNRLAQSDEDSRRNRVVCDFFEPGSTFKIVTASAALEEQIVRLDEKFFCENGAYRVGNHTLHDHKPHGNLTFVEVIEKSSNIGTVKIAQRLGPERLAAYVEKFGFGQLTGIDVPGETSGMVSPLSQWSKLSITAIPMGQEIGVTALQMARALAVIANGGRLVRPRVVSMITDAQGGLVRQMEPDPGTTVISEATAQTMRLILQGVVERGTAKMGRLEGYSAAGKTGTAQKVENGRYSHSKFIASFIGFAPVEKPRLVMAVVFDQPHPAYFGGVVSAPVFKNIAERVLRYWEVPKTPQPAAAETDTETTD